MHNTAKGPLYGLWYIIFWTNKYTGIILVPFYSEAMVINQIWKRKRYCLK